MVNDQNLNIDINKIYSDFIQDIDANRSIVNITNPVNNYFLNKLDKNNLINLANLVKVEKSVQESRTHCFYRLIGFPVIDKDMRYYNPGFDLKNIALDTKISIANNPMDGFNQLSYRRETYVQDILKTFSVSENISAIVLALTSTNVRNFNISVANSSDNFDMNIDNQSYLPELLGQIGKYNNILLTEYVDENGNLPILKKLILDRYHLIKPFMVDPRIDFSVAPSARRIGVPFVFDKSDLLISENTYVKRPLLEKVIRDRFTIYNPNSVNAIGTANERTRQYILNISTVKDDKLIQKMVNDIYQMNEGVQFDKFINIIQTMMEKLIKAQNVIQIAQSKYYWLPIPSANGTEGGSKVKKIIISDKLPDGDNKSFITVADRSLINCTLKKIANEFNAQTVSINGTPNIGNFAFEEFKTTFNTDTSSSFGDINLKELTNLTMQRDRELSNANQSLRDIEIIMGEFSGLGLCDIIAIMGALYLIPKEDLLGFLDDNAFNRMIISLNLEVSELKNPGIEVAMTSLVKYVSNMYNLMDKLYQDLRNNGNKRN